MRKIWLPLTILFVFRQFSPGLTLVHNLVSSPTLNSYYANGLVVVTYNIRGCRDDQGIADPDLIVAALRPLAADIIALQEVDNSLLPDHTRCIRTTASQVGTAEPSRRNSRLERASPPSLYHTFGCAAV